MANLKPTFSLSIGALSSTSTNAVGGPRRLVVDRDMSFAADYLELELTSRSGIALDDEFTVALGHEDERRTVFTGNVVEICPALVGVRIRALGKMNALLKLRTAATYEGQSVGSIVRDLIGQAGLDAGTIDDGPTLPRFTIDQSSSAYRYARDLADRLGYELYTDREGKVLFHALGAAAQLDSASGPLGGALGSAAAAALGLGGSGEGYQYGKHLIDAAARQRTRAWGTIEVGGESPMSTAGETTAHWLTTNSNDYRGSSGDGQPLRLVLDPVARTKDLADRFAAGYRTTRARASSQLCATVLGRPSLELGDNISVSDVPETLVNGSGYVQALRHRFGESHGFLTDLRIVLEGGS
jgi:phage protein D